MAENDEEKGVVSKSNLVNITKELFYKSENSESNPWIPPAVKDMDDRIRKLHIFKGGEVDTYQDLPSEEINNLKIYKVLDNQTYYYYDQGSGPESASWKPVGDEGELKNWDSESFPLYNLSYFLELDGEYGKPLDATPLPATEWFSQGELASIINVEFTPESSDPDGIWSLELDDFWAEHAGNMVVISENLNLTGSWQFTPTEESGDDEEDNSDTE